MATLTGKSTYKNYWQNLDVVLQVCSLSPLWRGPFLRLASLGQGAILDHGVFTSAKCILFSLLLKLCNRIRKPKIVIKFTF
jgi:hypothetical protein